MPRPLPRGMFWMAKNAVRLGVPGLYVTLECPKERFLKRVMEAVRCKTKR